MDLEVIGPDELGDAAAGFCFRPPPRFAAAREGARFALTSEEDPGILLVVPHDAPGPDALAPQLAQGWTEETVELLAIAPPTHEAGGTLRAELSGTLRGTPARAVVRAAFAPRGGGALVVALAAEAHWEPRRYDAYALMLVRSLRWVAERPSGTPPAPTPTPD